MIWLRNKPDVEDLDRPVGILMDGTEEARESQSSKAMAPLIMEARPIVLVFVSSADAPGQTVNELRRKIILGVCSDEALAAAVGVNGEIHYDGCEPGFSRAEQIACDMAITFSVKYTLNPSKLESTDKREDILAALLTALENIPTSD